MLLMAKRTPILSVLLLVFIIILYAYLWDFPQPLQFPKTPTGRAIRPNSSYDKSTPPSVGCEDMVHAAQLKIIETYSQLFKGIRYVNMFGYLETENKGDAAIWAAQQMLLTTMGITTMSACRYLRECDVAKFNRSLEEHKPHSAIVMAGGGNFNDFYWNDQPARIQMVSQYTDYPIRMFPQSMYMSKPDKIALTKKAFFKHNNLQLAARDRRSYEFAKKEFGSDDQIQTILSPDIAFMWGSRPDFRINTPKKYDVLILARNDKEVSQGNSKQIPFGEGELDVGGKVGKIRYQKVDWEFTPTPGINDEGHKEQGKTQRAWAKAIEGFETIGRSKFVITDRLHGHIMSTIMGTPHVLMDSKLKKNLNYHDTWTRDCDCTRIADNIEEAMNFVRMYFENEPKVST